VLYLDQDSWRQNGNETSLHCAILVYFFLGMGQTVNVGHSCTRLPRIVIHTPLADMSGTVSVELVSVDTIRLLRFILGTVPPHLSYAQSKEGSRRLAPTRAKSVQKLVPHQPLRRRTKQPQRTRHWSDLRSFGRRSLSI